ncbi:hypothetical protein, partial [Streptomyces sp. ISBFB 2968]|uniref:hypothetical protein n=1 Tax=Streptomyces sp. ISBFB 2968 TaxID=2903527 RepID=UPI002FDBBE6B
MATFPTAQIIVSFIASPPSRTGLSRTAAGATASVAIAVEARLPAAGPVRRGLWTGPAPVENSATRTGGSRRPARVAAVDARRYLVAVPAAAPAP